jgi:predicted homoserine dehydrogenase-like protein
MYQTLLAKRAAAGNPIRVGIVGSGKFGAGVVAQLTRMQGMDAVAVADINLDHAQHAYTASGIPANSLRRAKQSAEIDDAIRSGKFAVTEDGMALINADQVDVVVEATGIPEVGARMAYHALLRRKHVIMVNVEADVTVGALLRRTADAAGVVYTLVDGDQPGSTMLMVDWARTLGFEIVAAGRGTVLYADDPTGTPDTVPQRYGFSQEMIERRTINLKMYNSFRDGSKAQLEMTALANAAGLVPDVRGMHEPSVNIEDIARLLSHEDEGGVLSQHGVVELANSVAEDGKTLLPNGLNMGVFVVVRTDHPHIAEDLKDIYHLHHGGNDRNYLLWRPYHLVSIEAPMSIMQAVFFGQPTAAPQPTPTAEVIAVAKRALKAGETLDGSGGYTISGVCEKAAVARDQRLLPLGLSDSAKLKQDVAQGAAITYDMVDLPDSFVLKLRRLQDASVW